MTVELAAQIDRWSNLTLKCNANTFVKVDERIEGNCRRTISYPQGYSRPKLQLQETERSEIYSEYSSQCKKNNFMLSMPAKKKEFLCVSKSSNLLCFCPSLFETYLNKANYMIYEKLSRVFSVTGFRFEEK